MISKKIQKTNGGKTNIAWHAVHLILQWSILSVCHKYTKLYYTCTCNLSNTTMQESIYESLAIECVYHPQKGSMRAGSGIN